MHILKKVKLINKTKLLVWGIILVNIIFLIAYKIYLKGTLLNHFKSIKDIINKEYYLAIFSHLEYPVIFITIVLFLLLLFYSKINRIIYRIKSEKSFLVLMIILNIVLQAIILFTIKTVPFADAQFYVDLGKRLYKTGSYLNNNGIATSFWPVGLPAYLSMLMHLTSHFIIAAEIVNILISSLFILLLYFLFREELSVRGRIIFLLIFTLFPNNLFSVNCILTEYPFTFLLWSAVFIIIKHANNYWSIILSSIIIGLLAYIRASGLLIPIIIFIYLIKKDEFKVAFRKGLIMILVFSLVIVPWIYRNYQIFNKFVPISTNGGFNFLMGNHTNSSGDINFNFHYNYLEPEPVASNEAYLQGIKDIISNPFSSIIRIPKKIFFSYYRGDSSITWSLKKTRNNISAVILSFIFFTANYIFYLLIGLSILILLTKKVKILNNGLKYFMISSYVFFILIIIIYVGSERYIIPLFPVHTFIIGKYFS